MQELTHTMMDIGFKENLFGEFRCAYAAVIDAGELILEKLENDRTKYVHAVVDIDNGDKIRILSSGYDTSLGRRSEIQVNDIHFPHTGRGLFFCGLR